MSVHKIWIRHWQQIKNLWPVFKRKWVRVLPNEKKSNIDTCNRTNSSDQINFAMISDLWAPWATQRKTERLTHTHTVINTPFLSPCLLLLSLSSPLCPSPLVRTCQEIIGSTEKGQILFSQFKFSWAHAADYSKLINRHVMNKNTLIMKRGCPLPPFRLVISMRTHVVNSWSVATSSPRQPQMPSFD